MPALRATVSHFEIPARDPVRLAAFYREVFAWEAEAVSWAGSTYFKLRTEAPASPSPRDLPGAIQGGLGDPATIGAAHPLLMIHISGSPLTEVLASIEAAGGSIEAAPRAVGTFGHFASFRDPEGNLLGLWSKVEPTQLTRAILRSASPGGAQGGSGGSQAGEL